MTPPRSTYPPTAPHSSGSPSQLPPASGRPDHDRRPGVAVATLEHVTAQAVVAALQRKYASPAWAFITQVRSQTGFATASRPVRTADAIALGLWPSRGWNFSASRSRLTAATGYVSSSSSPTRQTCWCSSATAGGSSLATPAWSVTGTAAHMGPTSPHPAWSARHRRAPRLTPNPLDRPFLASMVRRILDEEKRPKPSSSKPRHAG